MLPDLPARADDYFWHEDPGGHTYGNAELADRAAHWLNTHPGDHAGWKYEAMLRADASWTLARRWVGVSWSQLRTLSAADRRVHTLRLAAAAAGEPALRRALLTRADREADGGDRAGERADPSRRPGTHARPDAAPAAT